MSAGSNGRASAPEDLLEEDDRPAGSKSRFLVSLGKPQLAALRDYADKKGLSVAEVVRRAVDEFFDRRSISRDGAARENALQDGRPSSQG
jgi:hypothetical protein